MNFLLTDYNWVLVLVALVSGSWLCLPLILRSPGNSLSTAQAVMLINRERAVLIDVSDEITFNHAHAVGAKNAPLNGLEGSKFLPKKKNIPLVVLCSSDSRSTRAAMLLKKIGYENVHVLNGGTAAWRDAGLPIEKHVQEVT